MVCSTIGRLVLAVINFVFLIVSLVFLAAGVILAFFPGVVLKDAYDSVKDGLSSNAGFGIPENADDLANMPLLKEIGIGLLAFGILLFIVSFLGYCGSTCSCCCSFLLIIFAIIMIVLIIAEVIIFSLFFVTDSPVHDKLKDVLKDQITDEYDDDDTSSTFSMAFNILQQQLDCCGVDGVADFGTKDHRACEAGTENDGCYDKLTDLINDNKIWAALVFAGITGLQVVEIFFAIIIFKDNKVSPI